jgi:eukaryotic-like serine/threonine-protein kinase
MSLLAPHNQEERLARAALDRYVVGEVIAADAMGTLHAGRYLGPVGFSRPVLVKSFHPPYASDPDFVRALVRGARVAASVRQPNIVATLDVIAHAGKLLLVTDRVQGESLACVFRRRPPRPRRGQGNVARRLGSVLSPKYAAAVVAGVLHGLAAAHELRTKRAPKGVVHGALSPETVIVGLDGIPRVAELGMSRVFDWLQSTREGRFRTSLGYAAPELVEGGPMTVGTDLFALSALLWEALADRPLFAGGSPVEVLTNVLFAPIPSPRDFVPDVTTALADVTLKGLARNPGDRFSSAREMIGALAATGELAGPGELSEWADLLGAAAPT